MPHAYTHVDAHPFQDHTQLLETAVARRADAALGDGELGADRFVARFVRIEKDEGQELPAAALEPVKGSMERLLARPARPSAHGAWAAG